MHPSRLSRFLLGTGWLWAALLLTLPAGIAAQTPSCTPGNTVTADVVALDQVFFWNRLGAVQPQGMMFALRRDVVSTDGSGTLQSGKVQLRSDKRPRPLVLRMHAGGCLYIKFQNLLRSARVVTDPAGLKAEQPATRYASVHVMGLQLVQSELDDGSYVGTNSSSLVPPGGSAEYLLYAGREGEHLLHSMGTTTGGEGDGGQLNAGLFGAVVVEPAGSRWYRSQVTRSDLDYATTGISTYGHPRINYLARYPAGHKYANKPILDMLDGQEIVHSDLTAVIANIPPGTYPPISNIVPDRDQPFREYVIIYHDETGAVQAFPVFYDKVMSHTLHSVRDAFAINYGSAGAGAEIFANRINVGPMHSCVECKYEEFFLTSWAVGDPAMVVDKPANYPCTTSQILSAGTCTPTPGPKATKAFYPDDPSNVYHAYLNDHTKFRVLHGGSAEHHIHHLHAHQWLYSPDNDKSSYLDSQAIGPGGSFTAEIAYGGAGNLNKTPGDSIFHCHFYPHFAQGMWALWRVHDVFEQGTTLDSAGLPTTGANRALPDSEIMRGTPIPAVVPMPGLPLPPLPKAMVSIVNGEAQITNFSGSADATPGYPFFIPGKIGHRPPRPPRDVIDDGGLQRHVVAGGTIKSEAHTRHDFHKELDTLIVSQVAELGTAIETREMAFHQKGNHPTCTPEGICGVNYKVNGLIGRRGAPFAPPCTSVNRTYKGADIEDDVIFNKVGWHFPQQRFSSLWEDVDDFLGLSGGVKKPPEPLFFR
ncbi:MAG TPA: copper oxidase, partial [Thermoanaerobaculia bacterium]|nr:copper oxidase [Thermoanaerobaculia bacterium]